MTTAGNQPLTSYAEHRDALLDHAERMIEAGDRLQASEKMWGAAAHGVKAVSSARGWHHESHADTFAIARHIANVTGDESIWAKFMIVNGLHSNFYEDAIPLEGLRASLADARALVELLRQADRTIPLDASAPADRFYARRAQEAALRRGDGNE